MDMRNRKPLSISTTVCSTAPPSKQRAAPWVRLTRPDEIAAKLVGPVARQVPGRGQEQAVRGDRDRVRDTGHAVGEVGQQPTEILRSCHRRAPCRCGR